AEQASPAMIVREPRRMQTMMLGCGTEIPNVGIAVAGQERIAGQLVARPLADDGARHVADIVLVEAQQRAKARRDQRLARSRQPVVVQSAKVDALLEVDLRVAGCLQRAVPPMVRVDRFRPDDRRLAGALSGHGGIWLLA